MVGPLSCPIMSASSYLRDTDRRRLKTQRQTRAHAQGRYKGRVEDVARNAGIAKILKAGISWSSITAATGAPQATGAKRQRMTKQDLDAVA